MKTTCLAIVGTLVVLPGCGDDDGPTRPKDGQLQITASSFEFEPKDIAIYPDEAVVFKLESADVQHTFTIEELDVGVEIPAGELVTSELTARRSGSYTFYCTIPGHREQGMEGTLKVSRRPTPTSSSGSVGSTSGGY